MRCNQRGGFAIVAVVCGVMALAGQVVQGTVTNDRVYLFGDIQDGGPQDENATAGANLGASSNDVTIDSESELGLPGSDVDAQHLTVSSTTTGPRLRRRRYRTSAAARRSGDRPGGPIRWRRRWVVRH